MNRGKLESGATPAAQGSPLTRRRQVFKSTVALRQAAAKRAYHGASRARVPGAVTSTEVTSQSKLAGWLGAARAGRRRSRDHDGRAARHRHGPGPEERMHWWETRPGGAEAAIRYTSWQRWRRARADTAGGSASDDWGRAAAATVEDRRRRTSTGRCESPVGGCESDCAPSAAGRWMRSDRAPSAARPEKRRSSRRRAPPAAAPAAARPRRSRRPAGGRARPRR